MGVARFLDVGRGIALTGMAFCKKRIDFITLDLFHQVILESGCSGFFNSGRIRVGRHGDAYEGDGQFAGSDNVGTVRLSKGD